MTTKCFLLIAGSLLVAGSLQAQISITGGDLYVYQAGDGVTTAGSGVGAPLLIDQFSTSQGASSGTLNSFIAQTVVPTTPASAGGNFLSQGQGQQDGQMSYNAAANALVFG